LRSARFRTYLKRVVLNLVKEAARKARRRPRQLDDRAWKALEPWVEQSVTRSLDGQWMTDCLTEAAWQLWATSYAARTRGQRRLFEILYLSAVGGQRAEAIARRYGVDRTTISGLLTEARGRFVFLLARISGITERQELKELLADRVDDLKAALARVHADAPS
jgi:DNA-directed RNA polymerase specialized sigma24 family protein